MKNQYATYAFLIVTSFVISSCTAPSMDKQEILLNTVEVSKEFQETSEAMFSAGRKARQTFVANIGPNDFDISSQDIVFRNNPVGEGYLAYVEKKIYFGAEHFFIWVVVDNEAFNINPHSSIITPHLPWTWESSPDIWEKTNLSPHPEQELVAFIFEGKELYPYTPLP